MVLGRMLVVPVRPGLCTSQTLTSPHPKSPVSSTTAGEDVQTELASSSPRTWPAD